VTATNALKLRQQFADNLKEQREKRGLTREKLAGKAGISTSYLFMLEAATRDPALPMIGRLARALDVKPGALLAERS